MNIVSRLRETQRQLKAISILLFYFRDQLDKISACCEDSIDNDYLKGEIIKAQDAIRSSIDVEFYLSKAVQEILESSEHTH